MTIFSEVGRKIKSTRLIKRITQEDLAELIDMDVRSVIAIESGNRNPTLRTIYKICKAMKIKSSDLLPF